MVEPIITRCLTGIKTATLYIIYSMMEHGEHTGILTVSGFLNMKASIIFGAEIFIQDTRSIIVTISMKKIGQ